MNQYYKIHDWILLLCCVFIFHSIATTQTQWTEDGIKIKSATASFVNLRAVSDGNGGSFLVFEDTPFGDSDIHAQWLDGFGNTHWGTNGVVITSASGDQKYPSVTTDGSGGIYIAWQDEISDDIYAQHLDADGNRLWTEGGMVVCNETGEQSRVEITGDNNGGAILVWKDKRNGTDTDLYAQRINAGGTVQWTAGGVSVNSVSGNQTSHQIIGNDDGSVFIVWEDYRNGFSNINIYAQKLNNSGSKLWSADGVEVVTYSANQYSPAADTSGSWYVITWTDGRNDNGDIYAQSLDQNGVFQWTANGIPVCQTSGTQNSSDIISDGVGGSIVSWVDNRTLYDIYAQRLNTNGSPLWTTNGIPVNTEDGYQSSPKMSSDGNGGGFIVWYDNRSGVDINLNAQHLDASGNMYWDAEGCLIVSADGHQQNHTVVPDGSGGFLCLWQDARDSGSDIYAQLTNDNLTIGEPDNGTAWGGDQEQTITWDLKSTQTVFDHLTISLSIIPGDGYPLIIAYDINPESLEQSWTPNSINSTTCKIRMTAQNAQDSVFCIYTSGEFTIDSDAPDAFSLLRPENGETVELIPAFVWKSSDDNLSGLDHYELYIDGLPVRTDLTDTTYTLTEGEKLLSGTHTWTVKAVDGAGLAYQPDAIAFTATEDNTPPTPFHLVSPQHNSWTTETNPTFEWEASSDAGSGLKKYQLYINDQLQIDNISPATTSTNEYPLSAGEHSWKVAAVDSLNNKRFSTETRNIKLDNVPPMAFSLIAPETGSWTRDTTPEFIWKGTQDTTTGIGLEKYRLWIDDNLIMDDISGASTGIILPPEKSLSEGNHTWYMEAVDSLGNTRSSQTVFDLNIDVSPPENFESVSPENEAFVTTVSPELIWQPALDAISGIHEYRVWVDGQQVESGISENTYITGPLSQGLHTWKITAIDSAENSRTTSVFSFTVDTSPPEDFDIISPLQDETIHTNLPVFIWRSTTDAVSGFDRFTFHFDGETLYDDLSAQDTIVTFTTPLDNGSYDWFVTAHDYAGNSRSIDTMHLTIDCNPPVITSPVAAQATEDIPFTYTATAEDPDGEDVIITFHEYPMWLTPAGNRITGTPVEGTPDSSFLIVATDGLNFDSLEVALTVHAVNDPPVITSSETAQATEDILFTYSVTATDPDNEVIQYTFVEYPTWLSPSGNQIAGIPTEGKTDTLFVVTASDGSLSDTITVQVTVTPVNDPPEITSPNSATATEDILFSYTATAQDPDDTELQTVFSSYPVWLSPMENQISGTPAEGTPNTSFFITVSDGQLSDTLTVFLTVYAVNDPPVITSSENASSTEDIPFTYTATSIDPDNETVLYSFDNYPSWLSPDGNQISGTPTEGKQDSSFRLIASDGQLSDTITVNLTVIAVNDPPVIVSADSSTAVEKNAFTYKAEAEDIDGPLISIQFKDYPSWLQPAGSEITGTPPDACTDTTFKIIASDSFLNDTLEVVLTVTQINDPPTFVYPLPDRTIDTDDTLRICLDVHVFDPDNPDSSLTWSYVKIDTPNVVIEINEHTHIAVITSSSGNGNCRIVFTATDPCEASVSDTMRITITPATGVDTPLSHLIPKEYLLENNYPNPFNPTPPATTRSLPTAPA